MTQYLANNIENEAFNKFAIAHIRCKPQKKFWGKPTEKTIDVSFSWGSGIGVNVYVRCSICDVREEITDYSCW